MSHNFIIMEEPILFKNNDAFNYIIATAWDDKKLNEETFNKKYNMKYEIIDNGTTKRRIILNHSDLKSFVNDKIPQIILPMLVINTNLDNLLFDITYKKYYIEKKKKQIMSSKNYKIYTEPKPTSIVAIKNIQYHDNYFLCDIEYTVSYLCYSDVFFKPPQYLKYKVKNWLKKEFILDVSPGEEDEIKETETTTLPFPLSYNNPQKLTINAINGDKESKPHIVVFSIPKKPEVFTHTINNINHYLFVPLFKFHFNKAYRYKIVCVNTNKTVAYNNRISNGVEQEVIWPEKCHYNRPYTFYIVAYKVDGFKIESDRNYLKIYEKPFKNFREKLSI